MDSFKGVKITDISHRDFKPFKGFQTSKPVSRTKPMELNPAQQNAVTTYLRSVIRTEEGKKQFEKYSKDNNIESLCIHIGKLVIPNPPLTPNDKQKSNTAIISGDPEVAEFMDSVDPSSEFWTLMTLIDNDLHSNPKISLIAKIVELVDCNENAKKFIGKLTEQINIMMDRFEIFVSDSYKRAHAFMIVCKGEEIFRNMREDEVFLSGLNGQFADVNIYLKGLPDGI